MNMPTMEDFGLHKWAPVEPEKIGNTSVVHSRHISRYLGPELQHLSGLGESPSLVEQLTFAPHRQMEVEASCSEVAKSQQVRLFDIFALAPFMIWLGAGGFNIPKWAQTALVIGGIGTAYYNASNYMETKRSV